MIDETASVDRYSGVLGAKGFDNGLKWDTNNRNMYSRFAGFTTRMKNLPRTQE
jgi:hypothetical protein